MKLRNVASAFTLAGFGLFAAQSGRAQMTAGATSFLIRGGNAHYFVNESAASIAPTAFLSGAAIGMSFVLRTDGTVYGWGYNCEDFTLNMPKVVAVASSTNFAVAVLGKGTLISRTSVGGFAIDPPDTATMNGANKIGAGDGFGVVLGNDGNIYTWGPTPPVVPGGLPYLVNMSAAGQYVLALDFGGNVYAIGANASGTLATPVGLTANSVSAGNYHALAVRTDGAVAAWGTSPAGATTVPWEFDPANPGHSIVTAVAAGDDFSLALRADGTIAEWGDATLHEDMVPAVPVPAQRFTKIYAGTNGQCFAVRANGTLVCWGNATIPNLTNTTKLTTGLGAMFGISNTGVLAASGFLSNNLHPAVNDLTTVNGMPSVKQAVLTPAHGIVLRTNGTTVGMGSDDAGILSSLAGLPALKEIAVGENHGIGINFGNNLVGWGSNFFGESVPPAGTFTHVSAGVLFSVGMRTNGTVAAWGVNSLHQLDVPVGLSHVIKISCGDAHTLALLANGTVVAWGENHDHQCDVPVALDHVVAISASSNNSLALRSDGTWVGWGDAAGYIGTGVSALDAGRNFGGSFTETTLIHSHETVAATWFVDAGSVRQIRVNLRTPAPFGGATVSLSSSSPDVTIPAAVVIPAGVSSVMVPATADPSVSGDELTFITSTYQGVSKKAALTVIAPKVTAIILPGTMYGMTDNVGKVTLAKPAPLGGVTVTMASNNGNLHVPASVVVPAGALFVTFPVTTDDPPFTIHPHVIGGNASSFVTSNTATILVNTVTVTFAPVTVHGGMNIVEHIHYAHVVNRDLNFTQFINDGVLHGPGNFVFPLGAQDQTYTITTDPVAVIHHASASVSGPNYSHNFALTVVH